MFFNPVKYLLLICIPVISSLSPNLVGGQAADSFLLLPESLTLTFLEMKKHRNGQVSQAFTVSPPSGAIGPVTVLFLENQDPKVYEAPLLNNAFAIDVNKPSRIRLFVFAADREKTHVIHTNLVLFGKSGTAVKRVAASPADAGRVKTLPHISLVSARDYYWHQTGIPLAFTLANIVPVPSPGVSALENDRVTLLSPDETHPSRFVYTPPHDRRLKQSGPAATRRDTIFTHISHGPTRYYLAYALQVHRSRHAHDSHRAGMAVLGAGILFFTGLVLNKRRTAPWWNE